MKNDHNTHGINLLKKTIQNVLQKQITYFTFKLKNLQAELLFWWQLKMNENSFFFFNLPVTKLMHLFIKKILISILFISSYIVCSSFNEFIY